MDYEEALEDSPLSQELDSDGRTVSVEIYRFVGDADWTWEVVDQYRNSTLWEDEFETDEAALREVKKTIEHEGIGVLIGSEGAD